MNVSNEYCDNTIDDDNDNTVDDNWFGDDGWPTKESYKYNNKTINIPKSSVSRILSRILNFAQQIPKCNR